ncbi:MAG: hypothetical protein H2067_17815 [Alcanivorax sp.]|nr:hypothetical protein A3Q32_17785 [Alcanivorax sp. KX64203]MBA4722979.1 hypothetical protein [Alcanivorax sp.]
MTRVIEDKAREYLLTEFSHPTCAFRDKTPEDHGFDLWLEEQGEAPRKIELKATGSSYQRPSNLFERLVFNAEIEKQLFESGESVIARVFMGSSPPRVFIITNAIFSAGARLTAEDRYVVRGKVNYEDSITELA